MQQQQPGIVTHLRISSLLISRHLTRPRVDSVRTSSVPEVGVTTQKFATPLSGFLNPPLGTTTSTHRGYAVKIGAGGQILSQLIE